MTKNLKSLSNNYKQPHLKQTAEFIKKYLYVDDLLGATDKIERATKLRIEIQKIFAVMKTQITK